MSAAVAEAAITRIVAAEAMGCNIEVLSLKQEFYRNIVLSNTGL
jgi:hypothetical protein